MLFVGKNSDYYKRKWENMNPKRNGFSFNVAAFFLTLYWLGYRKMYKLVFFIALLFLAIDAVLYLVGYEYQDRKSTRLNSSHVTNSYAVFCFKKITLVT